MDQQNEERKVHYIDIGDCSISEAYIKIGRPDLASLYRRQKFIWDIGLGIVVVSTILNVVLLFLNLS